MSTKIICRANDCIFWENKICTAEAIIYDPKDGCLTYEVVETIDDPSWDNALISEERGFDWDDHDLLFDDDL